MSKPIKCLSTSISETRNHEKFGTQVYEQQVIITPMADQLTLDVFDILGLMQNLHSALNPEQKKNMIKILEEKNVTNQ